MMPVPAELTWLVAAGVLIALWLNYCSRDERDSLRGFWRGWQSFEDFVSQFLMLMMLATSAIQVFARHAFTDEVSLPWTEEAGRLAMVWATLWGAAALQRTDDHITMTAVFDLLPSLGQRIVLIVVDLVTLCLLVPITWWGWENARGLDIMWSISLGLPLSVFAYSIPVTGALMAVYSLALLFRRLTGRPVRHSAQPVEI